MYFVIEQNSVKFEKSKTNLKNITNGVLPWFDYILE